ncbi:MAG: SusD/RagB family nutrient-binding outer membrane lipoprotein [Bacteroidales bacterium]
MKRLIVLSILLIAGSLVFTSCEKDFLDVNVNPKAASIDQVQVEYFINNSITGAQMDPHVAERAFILYWKNAARFDRTNGAISFGAYDDGWSSDYYSYLSGWIKDATSAITVAEGKIKNGTEAPYTFNMMQVARIWRVYLMSEFADNFGPMPIDGFKGINPEFKNLKTVYEFMLSELKDAVSKIDVNITSPDAAKYDKAYGFNYAKWKKYGNSMRMRLAMRLSEVEPAYAKAQFEEAVAGSDVILEWNETFKVAERDGWDPLTPVMSREWNSQMLSVTMRNLFVGLGGVSSNDLLPDDIHSYIKPENYLGIRYENHIATKTNDPAAGFWLDGVPAKIDPRAYKTHILPGWFDNPDFSYFPTYTNDAKTVVRNLFKLDSDEVLVAINGSFTYNASPLGMWGPKGPKNQVSTYIGTMPRMTQKFRSPGERIFFAPWETYFLIAEASLRGWATPITAKVAYEKGIESSFRYFGVESFLGQYLASENYNNVGTSVKWDHTAEAPATVSKSYINGYTQEQGTYTYTYPKNTIYKNGSVNNDQLTKIITQKYLAQNPWLPLEAWNDHRRLGLPFLENPAIELPITTLPDLTEANYMQNSIKNFPQRLKYPSGLENSNPQGYQQAVGFLNGPDAVLTPLWWAKQN